MTSNEALDREIVALFSQVFALTARLWPSSPSSTDGGVGPSKRIKAARIG
jgi:hypothetical protein